MKHLIILILAFCSYGLAAQESDTTTYNITSDYRYEKVGNFHYYVVTTTNPDSSQTIMRSRPYTTKKQVIDLVKAEIDNANTVIENINKELQQKIEYLKVIKEQQIKFSDQIRSEIDKTKTELLGLRTNRKLVQESKEKLKAVQ